MKLGTKKALSALFTQISHLGKDVKNLTDAFGSMVNDMAAERKLSASGYRYDFSTGEYQRWSQPGTGLSFRGAKDHVGRRKIPKFLGTFTREEALNALSGRRVARRGNDSPSTQNSKRRAKRSGAGSRKRRNVRRRRKKHIRLGLSLETPLEPIAVPSSEKVVDEDIDSDDESSDDGQQVGTSIKFTKPTRDVQLVPSQAGSRLYELEKRAEDNITMFDRISTRVRALQPSTLNKRALRAYGAWVGCKMFFEGTSSLYKWATYKPTMAANIIQGAQSSFGRNTMLGYCIDKALWAGSKFVPGGIVLYTCWSAFYNYPVLHRMSYTSTALEALRVSVSGMTFVLNIAGFVQDTVLDVQSFVEFLKRWFKKVDTVVPNWCEAHKVEEGMSQEQVVELARARETCSSCRH